MAIFVSMPFLPSKISQVDIYTCIGRARPKIIKTKNKRRQGRLVFTSKKAVIPPNKVASMLTPPQMTKVFEIVGSKVSIILFSNSVSVMKKELYRRIIVGDSKNRQKRVIVILYAILKTLIEFIL